MDDLVVRALDHLVPGGIRQGKLCRGARTLRWVESGAGEPAVVLEAALGQPGSLVWAGVLVAVAAHTRVIAYDRAGAGASDPASPLTLEGQVGDLAAVIESAGRRCVVAGHSWGGLLAQLAARRRPDLIAGLVLADPADERFRAGLPPEDQQEIESMGVVILDQYSRGVLQDLARDAFRPYAWRLTANPQLRSLILDAYAWCHSERPQAQLTQRENQLFTDSIPVMRETRAAVALPDIPMTVLSATTGMPKDQRDRFTSLHAHLAATVPGSTHLELPDTGHFIPQERPELVAEAINLIVKEIRMLGRLGTAAADL
jgi:pimeloyl-ACP methyl ester carboxylesterase